MFYKISLVSKNLELNTLKLLPDWGRQQNSNNFELQYTTVQKFNTMLLFSQKIKIYFTNDN